MKSQRIFFIFLNSPSTVLVSLVQITCQNFRSELEKISAAQRYWLVLSVLAGTPCTTYMSLYYRLKLEPEIRNCQILSLVRNRVLLIPYLPDKSDLQQQVAAL